jgi:hypothetical protein
MIPEYNLMLDILNELKEIKEILRKDSKKKNNRKMFIQNIKNSEEIKNFLEKNCVFGESYIISMPILYEKFIEENNKKYFSMESFIKFIRHAHPELVLIHTNHGNFWVGIGLK